MYSDYDLMFLGEYVFYSKHKSNCYYRAKTELRYFIFGCLGLAVSQSWSFFVLSFPDFQISFKNKSLLEENSW